jgi:hypothetical protein
MATWADVRGSEPDLAELATRRIDDHVAYLATVRKDGSPRVHPVTPCFHDDQMYVRMYPTSPKRHDLRRDPRYAIHSQVDDSEGTGGEMFMSGRAREIDDGDLYAAVFGKRPEAEDRAYVMFVFDLEAIRVTLYENGETIRKRWDA